MNFRLPLSVILVVACSNATWAADSATPAAVSATSAAAAKPAESSGPLAVLKTIPLGGDGGWDYLTVDSSNHRLYVARATRVMVVDLLTDKLLAEIPDTPGCHGIALVPDRNEGFITSGGKRGDPTGNVIVFDTKTLKVLRKIPTGAGPDAILFDPASKKVFCFNHRDGSVTVIDPAAPRRRQTRHHRSRRHARIRSCRRQRPRLRQRRGQERSRRHRLEGTESLRPLAHQPRPGTHRLGH